MAMKYMCPKCGEDRHDRLFCLEGKLMCSTCDTVFDMDMDHTVTRQLQTCWWRRGCASKQIFIEP